jgi:hypothetical protein
MAACGIALLLLLLLMLVRLLVFGRLVAVALQPLRDTS